MKVYKTEHKSITAAEGASAGTTWYRVSLPQFTDFIEDHETNIFVKHAALTYLFDCLDLAQMYGSAVYDDELFICKTDGQPIKVKDDENVDPETAFKKYTPEDLYPYIEDAKDDTLIKYITYREMRPEILEEGQTDAAIEVLESREYSVEDVIKDYNEIW